MLQRNVSDIYVHPDWDAWDEKYDADLAILLLKEIVRILFGQYVCQLTMPPLKRLMDQ